MTSTRIIFFIFVLSLAGVKASQIVKETRCLKKNPFLADLQFQQVEVFNEQRPFTDGQVCHGEWKRFDTCCEVRSALLYAQHDAANIRDNVKNINHEFANYFHFMDSVRQKLYFISSIDIEAATKLIETRG